MVVFSEEDFLVPLLVHFTCTYGWLAGFTCLWRLKISTCGFTLDTCFSVICRRISLFKLVGCRTSLLEVLCCSQAEIFDWCGWYDTWIGVVGMMHLLGQYPLWTCQF